MHSALQHCSERRLNSAIPQVAKAIKTSDKAVMAVLIRLSPLLSCVAVCRMCGAVPVPTPGFCCNLPQALSLSASSL